MDADEGGHGSVGEILWKAADSSGAGVAARRNRQAVDGPPACSLFRPSRSSSSNESKSERLFGRSVTGWTVTFTPPRFDPLLIQENRFSFRKEVTHEDTNPPTQIRSFGSGKSGLFPA